MYPLSREEHAAISRCVSGIRTQLQDVSKLFMSRYGRNSSISKVAAKALVSANILQQEFMLLTDTDTDESYVAVESGGIVSNRGI